ncbi:hypothetical protein JHW43_008710 [Diplocarpon mali]|nr:hypothetical protein JHW43_008710 [Diplocarpon mali]
MTDAERCESALPFHVVVGHRTASRESALLSRAVEARSVDTCLEAPRSCRVHVIALGDPPRGAKASPPGFIIANNILQTGSALATARCPREKAGGGSWLLEGSRGGWSKSRWVWRGRGGGRPQNTSLRKARRGLGICGMAVPGCEINCSYIYRPLDSRIGGDPETAGAGASVSIAVRGEMHSARTGMALSGFSESERRNSMLGRRRAELGGDNPGVRSEEAEQQTRRRRIFAAWLRTPRARTRNSSRPSACRGIAHRLG